MLATAFVLGFHGCDAELGEQVLDGVKEIEVSNNPHAWLGPGAYFWEGGPKRALEWACFVKANPQTTKHRIKTPFVVGAIIEIGRCLDLTSAEGLADIKEGHAALMDLLIQDENIERPTNDPAGKGDEDLVKRCLDCAVIRTTHSLRDRTDGSHYYNTVRAPFSEGKPLYPEGKIMDKTHIQVCVRDPAKSILGYFRPRGQRRSRMVLMVGDSAGQL
jgi:hypothetical protein